MSLPDIAKKGPSELPLGHSAVLRARQAHRQQTKATIASLLQESNSPQRAHDDALSQGKRSNHQKEAMRLAEQFLRRVQKNDEGDEAPGEGSDPRVATTNGLPPLKNAMARDPRAGHRPTLAALIGGSMAASSSSSPKRIKVGYAAHPMEKSPTKASDPSFHQQRTTTSLARTPAVESLSSREPPASKLTPSSVRSPTVLSNVSTARETPSRIEKRRNEARQHEWQLHVIAEQEDLVKVEAIQREIVETMWELERSKIIRRILVAFEFYWAWLTDELSAGEEAQRDEVLDQEDREWAAIYNRWEVKKSALRVRQVHAVLDEEANLRDGILALENQMRKDLVKQSHSPSIELQCEEFERRRELSGVEAEKFGILFVKYRSVHYSVEERAIRSCLEDSEAEQRTALAHRLSTLRQIEERGKRLFEASNQSRDAIAAEFNVDVEFLLQHRDHIQMLVDDKEYWNRKRDLEYHEHMRRLFLSSQEMQEWLPLMKEFRKESEQGKMLYRRELRDEVLLRETEARTVLLATEHSQFQQQYRIPTDELLHEHHSRLAEERRVTAENAVRNASRAANQKWHNREEEEEQRQRRINEDLPTTMDGWGENASTVEARQRAEEIAQQQQTLQSRRLELESSESIRRSFVLQAERLAFRSLGQARRQSLKHSLLLPPSGMHQGSHLHEDNLLAGVAHIGDLFEHESVRRSLLLQLERSERLRLSRTAYEALMPSDEELVSVTMAITEESGLLGVAALAHSESIRQSFIVQEERAARYQIAQLWKSVAKHANLTAPSSPTTRVILPSSAVFAEQLREHEMSRRSLLQRSQQIEFDRICRCVTELLSHSLYSDAEESDEETTMMSPLVLLHDMTEELKTSETIRRAFVQQAELFERCQLYRLAGKPLPSYDDRRYSQTPMVQSGEYSVDGDSETEELDLLQKLSTAEDELQCNATTAYREEEQQAPRSVTESYLIHELDAAENRLEERHALDQLYAKENALTSTESADLVKLRAAEDLLCSKQDEQALKNLAEREHELELLRDLLRREDQIAAERDAEQLLWLRLEDDELDDRASIFFEEGKGREALVHRFVATSTVDDVWRVRETLDELMNDDLDEFEEL